MCVDVCMYACGILKQLPDSGHLWDLRTFFHIFTMLLSIGKINLKFLISSLPHSYSKCLEYSQNIFLQLICSVSIQRRSMCYGWLFDSKSLLMVNCSPPFVTSCRWLVEGTRSVLDFFRCLLVVSLGQFWRKEGREQSHLDWLFLF